MGLLEGPGLVIVSLLAALLGYRLLLRPPVLRRHGVPLPTPPGTLPLVGNGLLFLRARETLFAWFARCERRFGHATYQISVPSLPPGVVVSDPRNLEFVFKHEGLFAKGAFVKQRSWDLFGHGIINVDGDLWRAQRKAGLAFLGAANLRVLTDVALPRYLRAALDRLRAAGAEGAVVDLQALFHHLTSQLMGKMAYNMEMRADDDFTTAFDHASAVTAERFQNPLWPVTELFTGARFRRSLAVVRSFGEKIVQSAVKDRDARAGGGPDSGHAPESRVDEVSGSLIQSLLATIDDEKTVAEAALNYLSAGRDTVAQALTWTMMLLMHSRRATDRARKEVEDLLAGLGDGATPPDGDGGDDGDSPVGAFTPAALPYTTAVFYEALRLYPPVPIEIKQCTRATTLPDGTALPAGAVVLWCPWALGRSAATWGDDAAAFRPERWLADGDRLAAKGAAEFPVFNGGPRTCLGKRMAEALAVRVLAALLLRFRFMPAYGSPRRSRSSLTLPMDGGLPAYVKARDDEGGEEKRPASPPGPRVDEAPTAMA